MTRFAILAAANSLLKTVCHGLCLCRLQPEASASSAPAEPVAHGRVVNPQLFYGQLNEFRHRLMVVDQILWSAGKVMQFDVLSVYAQVAI